MKLAFDSDLLPRNAVLITCSSHEGRCRGILDRLGSWRPSSTIIYHYDDPNPDREVNHLEMLKLLRQKGTVITELPFRENTSATSLRDHMECLRGVLKSNAGCTIALDMSVFTKRHLLMLFRLIDDLGFYTNLSVLYTEPEDYDVSEFIPLSFGLKSFEQIPGFTACPDISRPIHLVLFLGYEGDRALAAYEYVQPMHTTLVLTSPPYKPSWVGRTEAFNSDLLKLVKDNDRTCVDGIDPDFTRQILSRIFGEDAKRSQFARIVCAVGTKPQTLGIYDYVRNSADPPAVVYASPLRHNHGFSSHGVGPSWIIRLP